MNHIHTRFVSVGAGNAPNIGSSAENIGRPVRFARDHRGILFVMLPDRARRRYRRQQMAVRLARKSR
jgi:hypothetical protein